MGNNGINIDYIWTIGTEIFMKNFFKKLFFFISFFYSFSTTGQEGLPIYTDYLTENYYLLHPSMAGVNLEGIKIRMTSRKHWLDQIN